MSIPAKPAHGANWDNWADGVDTAARGAAQIADISDPATPTGDALGSTFASLPTDDLHRLTTARTKLARVEKVTVPALGSQVIASIPGSGTISTIWLALGGPWNGLVGDARLQVFYDGSSTAAIDCDLGTLAALHYGVDASYGCHHIKVEAQGSNSLAGVSLQFPMPFGNGVEVRLYNPNSSGPVEIYGQVFYTTERTSPLRLHGVGSSLVAAPTTAANAEQALFDLTGSGWLVYQAIFGDSATGQSWLERNMQVTVDGTVDITTSGLEDWFHGSFYFQGRSGVSHRTMMVGYNSGFGLGAAVDLLELYGGIRFDTSISLRLLTEALVTTAARMAHYALYYASA